MSREDSSRFQLNLFNTMMAVEQVYADLAESSCKNGHNTLVISDRGAMDISACKMLQSNVNVSTTSRHGSGGLGKVVANSREE